tara:strand:+ start:230 stop:454 length:225 start_codon:yes stop_codon:yes gene_type:complete
MAITIDGKSYDESKLSDEVKSSIVQLSQQQARQKQLTAEFDNTKVLIKHHRDIITKGLKDEALVKDEKKEETKQ